MQGYDKSDLNSSGIPPLLERVESQDQWLHKRSRIFDRWMEVVGGLPSREPIQYEVLSESQESDHLRLHLVYKTAYGDKVPAYLLIPSDGSALAQGKRYPAVLALHPTAPEGKDDVATPSGREGRKYGLELVSRGYVVLAPDTITAGERVYAGSEPYQTAPFYEQYKEWSAVGKMMTDHQYGLDLLTTLDYVDPERIGAIGHSLGGYNAFFLAGADERIKAVVSSCGFSTFAGDEEMHRWGQRDWFSHLPVVSQEAEKGRVPFEFHEIAALAAPTPFFNWSAQQDRIFPHWKLILEALGELDKLYKWMGAEQAFVSLMGNSGHDFPDEIRLLAYRFLDRWLNNDKPAKTSDPTP
ncbi:S9 family peptidase [Paenibacillus sp. J2TS4]|uniref:alpha/beta hydrolase family protein n=1 Tax=Paenibacillus sp. J2TS4 TaxID=2807194 RepID=UPI001B15A006|nr:prolyl oligopeptidase family serine peptidase [Paenibacillus sp. J2TS4]GIP32934.1 hydrolase [Paenibacillus sp. J2TS4]